LPASDNNLVPRVSRSKGRKKTDPGNEVGDTVKWENEKRHLVAEVQGGVPNGESNAPAVRAKGRVSCGL